MAEEKDNRRYILASNDVNILEQLGKTASETREDCKDGLENLALSNREAVCIVRSTIKEGDEPVKHSSHWMIGDTMNGRPNLSGVIGFIGVDDDLTDKEGINCDTVYLTPDNHVREYSFFKNDAGSLSETTEYGLLPEGVSADEWVGYVNDEHVSFQRAMADVDFTALGEMISEEMGLQDSDFREFEKPSARKDLDEKGKKVPEKSTDKENKEVEKKGPER